MGTRSVRLDKYGSLTWNPGDLFIILSLKVVPSPEVLDFFLNDRIKPRYQLLHKVQTLIPLLTKLAMVIGELFGPVICTRTEHSRVLAFEVDPIRRYNQRIVRGCSPLKDRLYCCKMAIRVWIGGVISAWIIPA